MTLRSLTILLALLAVLPGLASAAGFAQVGITATMWEDIFKGPRNAALGGADLAGDTGPGALLRNPAPLPGGDGIGGGYAQSTYTNEMDFDSWGASAEYRGWRLDFSRQSFTFEGIFRTAYDPDGEFRTWTDRVTLLGLSRDLGDLVFRGRDIRWTVGAVRRHHDGDPSSGTADTYDFGTSLCLPGVHPGGDFALKMTASRQNLTGETLDSDGREMPLPEAWRLGFTFATGFDHPRYARQPVRTSLSFARIMPDEPYGRASNHFGLELLLLELIAFRFGQDSGLQPDGLAWGLGMVLDRPRGLPLEVAADFCILDRDPDTLVDDFRMEMWGLRGKVFF
ncbi:MAG: hypothetical protein AB7V45_06210 [Candidatus Krumholzibacteriia bacterium]